MEEHMEEHKKKKHVEIKNLLVDSKSIVDKLDPTYVLDDEFWYEIEKDGTKIYTRNTQDGWIKKYNGANKIMASMSDIYLAMKYGNEELLKWLRKGFHVSLETSTRTIYNENDLSAIVIHHYGSNVIPQKEIYLDKVPTFSETHFENFTNKNSKGFSYIQALFDTSDSAEEIVEVFRNATNRKRRCLNIYTDSDNSRGVEPACCTIFFDGWGYSVIRSKSFITNVGLALGSKIGDYHHS